MILRLDLALAMLAFVVAVPAQAEEPAGRGAGKRSCRREQSAGCDRCAVPTCRCGSGSRGSRATPPLAAHGQARSRRAPEKDLRVSRQRAATRRSKERAALAAFYGAAATRRCGSTSKGLTTKAREVGDSKSRTPTLGVSRRRTSRCPSLGGRGRERIRRAAGRRGRRGTHAVAGACSKYARFARGGRIMKPVEDLELASRSRAAADRAERGDGRRRGGHGLAAPTLRGLHPQQPQFELLRQKYLASRGGVQQGGKLGPHQGRQQEAAREHGNVAVDVARHGRSLRPRQRSRVHAARREGRQGRLHREDRRRRGRQADVDLHADPEAHRLPAEVARAGEHQGQGAVAEPPAWRRPHEAIRPRGRDQGRQAARLAHHGLGEGGHPQLRGDAAARAQERARRGQVLVSEPAHDLHARHAGQIHVRRQPADAEPRMPAAAGIQ